MSRLFARQRWNGVMWMRDLAVGLTTPSPLAAGVAIGLTLAACAWAVLLITAARVAAQGRTYLASSAEDYDAVASADLLAFQHRTPVPEVLVVLGGSTARASLLEEDLRGLNDATARRAVLKLCTSRQSLWETLALAEQLDGPLRGHAIVGVGPSLFAMGDEMLTSWARQPRLGVRSDSLDRAQASRGLPLRSRTGVYALDNAPFLLARRRRLVEALFGIPGPPFVDSVYQRAPAQVSDREWNERARRVAARYPEVERHWEANARVLERVIDELEGAGLRVILVETPVNPRFAARPDAQGVTSRHRARLSALARGRRVSYVVLNEAARLGETDFVDWAHIRTRDAARRCAEALRPFLQPVPAS